MRAAIVARGGEVEVDRDGRERGRLRLLLAAAARLLDRAPPLHVALDVTLEGRLAELGGEVVDRMHAATPPRPAELREFARGAPCAREPQGPARAPRGSIATAASRAASRAADRARAPRARRPRSGTSSRWIGSAVRPSARSPHRRPRAAAGRSSAVRRRTALPLPRSDT